MKRLLAAAVLVVALAHANFVYGQGTLANATLQGRVLDQSGAVIPGATLELVELNKGSRSTSVSDSSGYYSFAQIPYGSYSLKVGMKGFGDTTVSPINVTAREVASVDVSLKPGTVVQTVEVLASALRLESQTSDVGQDLVTNIVTTMPIPHRNVIELVGLVPGVLQNRTQGGATMNTADAQSTWGHSNLTVGGGMRNTSSFSIDGVDATHSFSPGGGNAMVFISPDSVEEFRLHLFDSPADLPRGSGVLSLVSSLVTKSGTNALHGALYYFQQNAALNATDFFTNKNGQPKPPLVRHEYGGSIGGPVVIPKIYDGRNKTFFFFDYDEIRQPLATTFQARVPTADELNGNFAGVYASDGNPVTIYNPVRHVRRPGRPGER